MINRLNLRTSAIIVAVIAIAIAAGIAYALQIQRDDIQGSFAIGQVQTAQDTILLYEEAPPSAADLVALNFGTGDIDAFGSFVTPPTVPFWAANGGGTPFELTLVATNIVLQRSGTGDTPLTGDILSLLMGPEGGELLPALDHSITLSPGDPPVALRAGLKLLKTPGELGVVQGDSINFTALFTAEAVTVRFLPTGLDTGDVKTLFTTGIVGGPALLHGHGTAYDTNRNTLWVTDFELGDDIFEFDVTTGDGNTIVPLTRLDVPVAGPTTIEGIGFDPADNTLYYLDTSGLVRHIQRDGTVLDSFPTNGVYGLAVQGGFVWVDNGATAYKYDKVTGAFTGVSFPIGDIGLAFDFDRNLLWAGHAGTGTFAAFDVDTGGLVFQSPSLVLPNGDGRGHNLAYGAGRIWVTTESLSSDVIYGIRVLDAPAGTVNTSALTLQTAPAPPATPVTPTPSQ